MMVVREARRTQVSHDASANRIRIAGKHNGFMRMSYLQATKE